MGFLDFFKPQWKHSDPAMRAAAIRALEEDQQEVLYVLAYEDADAGNRMLAARKLKSMDLLKKLRDKTNDRAVREWAQKAWVERAVDAAKTSQDDPRSMEDVRGMLAEVGEDQRALEAIATGASALEIRKLAFAKLIHASAHHAVALSESDNGLALRALDKVARESQLESLAKGAVSKAVRTAAKERLKSAQAAKGPDAASVNRAKLGLVLSAMEKAAAAADETPAHYDWEKGKARVDETEAALEDLIAQGAGPDAARLARFREGASRFHARYARWRHEKNEKQEKDRQALADQAVKETICAELEALWAVEPQAPAGAEGENGPEANPLAPQIRALRERFLATGPSPEPAEGELQKRFRGAVDRLEKRSREREAATRRASEDKEHGGRLRALCEQAEALAQVPALQAAERFRELRREWNKALAGAERWPGREEYRARFDSAVGSLEGSLDQLRASNLDRMQSLLPQLEGLLESPDMTAAEKRFKELNGEWRALHPVPHGPGADEALGRYQAFLDRFREASDWLRWSNLRAKTSVCERLESLAASADAPQANPGEAVDRKAMVARFKELLAEWKSLGPVPWDSSEALWERYHHACDKLYERCREYFAELDEEREGNLKAKEELCARIEALNAADEIDWRDAMETVKETQSAWKALGAVPKAQSEAIWTRFRAACGAFFERKDKQNQDNLARKQELAALAESLADSTEWKAAGAKIKEAQEKWKAIGPVPRDQAEAVWGRFHGACERFFTARRAFMEKLDTEKPLNLAKKEDLIKGMEGLGDLPDDQARFDAIKQAQSQWKETGPAGTRETDEALWERFRKPIDAYFEGRKARVGEERAQRDENGKMKEDICLEAESLIGSTEWKATIDKIKSLQERWKATGPASREADRDLWKRFRSACDGFFDRLKENSAKRDQERESNLKRKIELCFLAESWVSRPLSPEEAEARAAWEAKSLPVDLARFKAPGGAVDWNAATETIKALQREWKKLGPVPRELSDSIWERFHAACDGFFEERRAALGLRPEDPQANLERKLELIAEAEELARNPGPASARRGEQLEREWKRIGAVPRAQSDYVWNRFQEAMRSALGGSEMGSGNDGAESEAEAAANP
ncbi:MAG: DUF349 domain-containing protein [Fibrobacteres bacterium]|nr:DUF349 domain-containing protein [Fibrobacterota bacterium]